MVGEAHPESVLTVRLPRKKEGDAVLFYDYPAVERPWQNYVAEQQYGFGELTEEKGEAAQAFLTRLQEDPSLYGRFLNLPARLQKELVDFYTGQKGVKITYDPFFKYVFNPELHPERLERLLSGLLKEKVKIRQVLPTDSIRLDESMSLVVMWRSRRRLMHFRDSARHVILQNSWCASTPGRDRRQRRRAVPSPIKDCQRYIQW